MKTTQKVWHDKEASNLILQDGEVLRHPLMLKDAAQFCDACSGSGKIKDLSIKCPVCSGSGLLNSQGQGINETVAATSNNTEGARGGTYGNDHALSDAQMLDRHMARDAAWRDASAGHRAGFRITDAVKAHHTRMMDLYSKLDDEREAAYLQPLNPSPDVAGSPARNIGKPQDGDVIKNGECEDSRSLADKRAQHQQVMNDLYEQYSQQQREAYRTLK